MVLYSTTLLKYSLKPVLRIVIDSYETRWITQRTSRSSVCHFWITVGRLRLSTAVRWPAVPICIFLGFPKNLRLNSGIVFNLGKDHFLQYHFKIIIDLIWSRKDVWSRLMTPLTPLTPNDHYSGRTAPLTSTRCILYTYSTNIGTEYFKHGTYSSFFLFKMYFVS